MSIEMKMKIEDDEAKFIKEKLSKLPIHQLIKQIKLDELLWGFYAVSFYPSAIRDKNTICRRTETSYAFSEDMKDELVKKFDTGNFNQGCAFLKIRLYIPTNLIVEHLPIKEKVEKK